MTCWRTKWEHWSRGGRGRRSGAPKDAAAYVARGLLHAEGGSTALAEADFEAALKIDPTQTLATDQLNRLRWAPSVDSAAIKALLNGPLPRSGLSTSDPSPSAPPPADPAPR